MILFASATLCAKCEYKPLLEEGKEWGYVDYFTHNESLNRKSLDYYRLCCGSPLHIGDKEYFPIYKYSSLLVPDENKPLVYMREDNGKVYVHYPHEILQPIYDWDDVIYGFGKLDEYLIYDFSLQVGERMTVNLSSEDDEQSIAIECIETGIVETSEGQRKFLKFKKNSQDPTRHWVAYEYLIEGLGPIGNCNLAAPYRAEVFAAGPSSFKDIDFIYQRKSCSVSPGEAAFQGKMIYVPIAFEAMGIYDPSVWFWNAKPDDNVQLGFDNNKDMVLPDLSIYMSVDKYVCSHNDPLTKIEVMDVLGRVIDTFFPNATQFLLDKGNYKEDILFIKAYTQLGTRTFRWLLHK